MSSCSQLHLNGFQFLLLFPNKQNFLSKIHIFITMELTNKKLKSSYLQAMIFNESSTDIADFPYKHKHNITSYFINLNHQMEKTKIDFS